MFNLIFEIPVYRLSPDDYQKEIEKEKRKHLLIRWKTDKNLSKEQIEEVERFYNYYYWKPWFYNEIIAYVRVYCDGRKVYGDLYKVTVKSIRKWFKKNFEYWGKFFEVWYHEESNDEFVEIIKYFLKESVKSYFWRKRYVDFEAFDRVARVIDWKKLVNWG